MKMLKVKDVMTIDPAMIKPEQTVRNAARLMEDNDCGVLPVGTPAKVLGVLTDRDIAIRVVAQAKDPLLTKVESVMSKKVFLCEEKDSLAHAADLMRKHDVSRLMVSDGAMITGIVTLADLLRNTGEKEESEKVMRELLYPREKINA